MVKIRSVEDYKKIDSTKKIIFFNSDCPYHVLTNDDKITFKFLIDKIKKFEKLLDNEEKIIFRILNIFFWNGYIFESNRCIWLKQDGDTEKIKKEKQIIIKSLIERDEDIDLEFKSSFKYDFRTKQPNPSLQRKIIEEITGFLNTSGGFLLIGVTDEKLICGIDNDLKIYGNWDKLYLSLISKIKQHLGVLFNDFVKISKIDIINKTICLIEIEKSSKPCFFRVNNDKIFIIRSGPRLSKLDAEETHNYIDTHFRKQDEKIISDLLEENKKLNDIIESLKIKQLNPIDSNFEENIIDQINLLIKENRFNEALDVLNNQIDLNPNNQKLWEAKGDIYLNLDNIEKAIDCYDEYLLLKPKSDDILLKKSDCLVYLRENHVALTYINEVLSRNSCNVFALKRKITILNKFGYTLGDLNYISELHETKLKLYDCVELLLKNDPDNFILLKQKLWISNELEKYDIALEITEKLLKIDSNDPYLWYEKGYALRHLGADFNEIEDCFNKAKILNTGNIDFKLESAVLYIKNGKFNKAIHILEEILFILPVSLDALFWMAKAYYDINQYGKAVYYFDEILNEYPEGNIVIESLRSFIKPNDNLIFSLKSICLFRMGKYNECIDLVWTMIEEGNFADSEDICIIIDAYNELIKRNPKDIMLYIKKAQAAYWTRLGCSPHPVESLEKILEIDARNIKRFPEIIDEFEALRKADPNDMILIGALMYLQHKVENHKKILEYLTNYVDDDDFREIGFDNYTIIVDSFIAEKRFDEGLEFCDKLLESPSEDDNFLEISENDIKALKEKIRNKMTEK